MNVKVEIELYDLDERAMFEDLVAKIDRWRGLTAVERYEQSLHADPAQLDLPLAPGAVSATLTAEPAKVTIADLEAALTAYYKREGLPAAKAVLAEFSAARVGDISEDFWPELMERLK